MDSAVFRVRRRAFTGPSIFSEGFMLNQRLARAAMLSAALLATPTFLNAQTSGTWDGLDDGSWGVASNWIGAVPNGGGTASFVDSSAGLSPQLNISPTLVRINFQDPQGSAILGPGPAGTGTITLSAGATINSSGFFRDILSGGVFFGNAIGTVGDGVNTFNRPVNLGGSALTITGGSAVSMNGTNTYAGLTIAGGSRLTIRNGDSTLGSGSVTMNDGKIFVDGSQVGALTTSKVFNIGAGGGEILTNTNVNLGTVNGAGNFLELSPGFGATGGTVNFNGTANLGTLQLNFGTMGVGAAGSLTVNRIINGGSINLFNSNRISPTTVLEMRGGAVRMEIGQSQTFGQLVLNSGINQLVLDDDASITFASINRQKNAGLFLAGADPDGNGGSPKRIFVTTPPAQIGGGGAQGSTTQSIVPWIQGNFSQFAGEDPGNSLVTYDAVKGFRPLDTFEYVGTIGAAGATSNVRVTANEALPANKTINALNIIAPTSASSVSLSGSGVLNLTSGALHVGFGSNITGTAAGLSESTISHGITTSQQELVVFNTSALAITGPISGNISVTKIGGRTLQLDAVAANGLSSYTGTTTIAQGFVRIYDDVLVNTNGPLGNSSTPVVIGGGNLLPPNTGNPNAVFFWAGTTAGIFNRDIIVRSSDDTVDNGNSQLGIVNNGTWTINGNISLESTLLIRNSPRNAPLIINGVVSGPGGLQNFVGNYVILNGNNTFTGGFAMNINDDTSGRDGIGVGNNNALGTGPVAIEGVSSIESIGAARTVNNEFRSYDRLDVVGTLPFTFGGEFNTESFGLVNVTNTATTTWSGSITRGDFFKQGAGPVVLSGNNTNHGVTSFGNGTNTAGATNIIANNNALGSTIGFTQVVAGSTVTVNPGLNIPDEGLLMSSISPASSTVQMTAAGTTNWGNGGVALLGGGTSTFNVVANANLLFAGGFGVGAGTANVGSQINKIGAGTLGVGNYRASALNIAAGTVRVLNNGGTFGTSVVNTLNIAGGASPTARLDLGDNDLIIDYTGASPYSTVRAQVTAGHAFGAWNGNGIASRAANLDAAQITALGLVEGADYIGAMGNTFSGQTIDATSLLIKYTYYGDTDLSGEVDFDDYARIDTTFLGGGVTNKWFDGDFDYNGVVDFDDYALIDAAFLSQSGPLDSVAAADPVRNLLIGEAKELAQTTRGLDQNLMALRADMGDGFDQGMVSLVPEPATMSLLALGGLALARRRRA
jgi:hypothetical protein